MICDHKLESFKSYSVWGSLHIAPTTLSSVPPPLCPVCQHLSLSVAHVPRLAIHLLVLLNQPFADIRRSNNATVLIEYALIPSTTTTVNVVHINYACAYVVFEPDTWLSAPILG